MRTFIAIEFDDETKNKILDSLALLKEASLCANYSKIDNYHLTLSFLGEVDELKINTIKRIMDAIKIKPFDILIKGFNYFKKDGKAICFRDIELNDNLINLNITLTNLLDINKFYVDSKEFKAHITMSRETIFNNKIDIRKIRVNEIRYNVKNISLMKSERINGLLTYTCIYKKELK